MSGFSSPNYTQTPNDFFEMIKDMEASEVRVTLVMIRKTFGFHRDTFKMSIKELAEASGLSRNAAKAGAEAAEKRGTFRRTNPEEQTQAEWELIVSDGQPLTPPSQPVTTPRSTSDPQGPLKERIKKDSKEKLAQKRTPPPPEVILFRETTEKYPPKVNFDDVVKSIAKVSSRIGRLATREDLLPFYKKWCSLGYKATNISWLEWAENGQIPNNGTWKPSAQTPPQPKGLSVAQQWLEKKGIPVNGN